MISEKSKNTNFILFASGDGTNAENLWHFFKKRSDAEILHLFCDRAEAGVLKRASTHHIPYTLIEKYQLTRRAHEDLLLQKLKTFQFDYILLCGYRNLLSKHFVGLFPKKIINIHPSLLPKYPGLHAYERAFHEGEVTHGATVHFVDEGMDTGEIILQKTFRRDVRDDFSQFKKRGMELEYKLYPEAILKILEGTL